MRRIWTIAVIGVLTLSGCVSFDGSDGETVSAQETVQPQETAQPEETVSEDEQDDAPGPLSDADQVSWDHFTLMGLTRCRFEGDLEFGGDLDPGRAAVYSEDEGADSQAIYHDGGMGFELDYEDAEPLAIGPGGREYLMVPFSCFAMNEDGEHWGTSAAGWDNGFLLLGQEEDGSIVEVGSLNRSDEHSGFDNTELADRGRSFELQREVAAGTFLAEETFYREGDAGCCPEGQAWSLWSWDDQERRVVRVAHSTDGPPSLPTDDHAETEQDEEIDAGDPDGEIVRFSIEEEDWIEDICAALAQMSDHSVTDYERAASNPQQFGLPSDVPDLQGYLPPGDYAFSVDAEPEDILQAMVDRAHGLLAEAGLSDPEEQHEAVTIASLIEGQSMPEQYPTVAGVIQNRTAADNSETDGYLQIDSTVRYGLGDMDRELSEADRQDSSNEYNTYQHRGLPPGPITTPSFEALQAAASPENTSYNYWTIVDGSTKEAKFAEDYTTHMENAQEYRD